MKLWFVVQALPVLDPQMAKLIRYHENHIRDANEIMRRRRGVHSD